MRRIVSPWRVKVKDGDLYKDGPIVWIPVALTSFDKARKIAQSVGGDHSVQATKYVILSVEMEASEKFLKDDDPRIVEAKK